VKKDAAFWHGPGWLPEMESMHLLGLWKTSWCFSTLEEKKVPSIWF
jgi:hypothetical protein